MTQRDLMRNGENLGWCKPYISKNKIVAFALNEGEICSMMINGAEVDVNAETIKTAAQLADEYYSDYKGYTDADILINASKVVGCLECPFCHVCDAMDEEVECDNNGKD